MDISEVCIFQNSEFSIDELVGFVKKFSSAAFTRQMIETMLFSEDYFVLCAKKEGVLCGYAAVQTIFSEAELHDIAVHKDFLRQGFGEKLLEAACKEAKFRGAEKMFLEVAEGNIPAQRLYQKKGFSQLRKREKYYCEETALIMQKDL